MNNPIQLIRDNALLTISLIAFTIIVGPLGSAYRATNAAGIVCNVDRSSTFVGSAGCFK